MAARSTFHAAQLCPRGSALSTVMNCGTRAPTKDTSRAPRHHLHVAQTFRATGTLYIGTLSLCLDLNVRRGLPAYGKKPSPHRVSAEATGMPEGRTQCGDERAGGHNAPPAHVSTTCANSNQMITSLPADQRQTFSTARNYIRNDRPAASAPPGRIVRHNLGHPPSGYQPHRETRTRRRRMTVRFENCLGSITNQGETDGFLTNPPNDRRCHPILQFRNKTYRVSPLLGTQKTLIPSSLPLHPPFSRFLQGNQGSSKNRDKDASMLF